MVDEGHEGGLDLGVVGEPGRPAEDHDRSVVQGMVELALGQDQSVDMGHGHTHRDVVSQAACDTARHGAVQQQAVAVPSVHHRDHEGLVIGHEPHMGDESLVEDRVGERSVVARPGGDTTNGRCRGDREGGLGIGHVDHRTVGPGAVAHDFFIAAASLPMGLVTGRQVGCT